MTAVFVVDRSNNNPPSDAELAAMKAAGIAGVILKATEGTGFVDPTFVDRADAAHRAVLIVGAYAFVHADVDALAQAELFDATVADALAFGAMQIPVRCCDAETAGGDIQATVDVFCPRARINVLYSGAYFARTQLTRPVPGVDWWIAAYGATHPVAPWGLEAGWQFSQTSRWGDCSVFDEATWLALIDPLQTEGELDMPIFLSDDDARRYQVRRWYVDELGRDPTVAEQTAWVAYIIDHGADLTFAAIRDSTEAVAWRKAHQGLSA